ncbi:MAG: hypothetical protein ABF264_05025 [Flavobacteriales bacterium]
MKPTTQVLAFLASFFISSGIMFKIFHWPYAEIILFSGFMILNFGFLPIFFFGRKKTKEMDQ